MELVRVGEPHIRKQRGKWVVRIEGYDPASGKLKVRQAGTFETKRAATEQVRRLADGRVGTDGETLSEFLEQVWLPSKEARVEQATLDQYTWAVRRHIVPLIGAARLRDLSPELLDEWVAALVAADESGRARLGSTSARTVRKVLSMALEEATQRGRLARNPVALHRRRPVAEIRSPTQPTAVP